MTKERGDESALVRLTGVDHLFGRDLRQGGWSVDAALVGGSRGRRPPRRDDLGVEPKPDPAVIWALRHRKR